MPLKTLSAEVAVKNLKSRTSIWPERGKQNRKGCLPLPALNPSFQIGDSDQIFCMGSCFAAHIGAVLRHLRFGVVTAREHPFLQGDLGGSNHLIRYNVFSILNELRWALASEPVDHEALFIEEAPGLWTDPYGHPPPGGHPLERLRAMRAFTTSVTQHLRECRIVLLTLGLIEVWYDQKHRLYMNAQPSKLAMHKEPDRFVLNILSFEDIVRALEEIHTLLGRCGHPDVRILLTTSPVPLQATYSGQDVFVANTHSKSVQRAAMGEFVTRHANVDYFPSYETVTLGHPDMAWKDDQRHVTEHAVQLIMEHVVRSFAPQRRIATPMIETMRNLDQQLNGMGSRSIWEKVSSLATEVERQRVQLAALQAENAALKLQPAGNC